MAGSKETLNTEIKKKQCECLDPSVHRFEPLLEAKFRECNTLTEGQQKGLQDLKMQIRKENEDYLIEHPEISALVEVFLEKLLRDKPRTDFLARAVEFFSRPEEEMQSDIQKYLTQARPEPPTLGTCRLSDIYVNPFPTVRKSSESSSSTSQQKSGSGSSQTSSKNSSTLNSAPSKKSISVTPKKSISKSLQKPVSENPLKKSFLESAKTSNSANLKKATSESPRRPSSTYQKR